MKRIIACLMVALILLGCVGCGNKEAVATTAATTAATETTQKVVQAEDTKEPETQDRILFPKDAKLLGVEVGELDAQQAYDLVSSVLAVYSLEAVVNNKRFYISAEDVLMTITLEEVAAYAEALQTDANAKAPELTLDSGLLRQKIAAGTGSSVVEAKVVFNKSLQAFEVTKERSGVQVDTYEASKVLEPAMLKLEATASVTVQEQETEPTTKSTDPALQSAKNKANNMLGVTVTYVYAPDNEPAKSQTVTKSEIGAMIAFDGAMNPYINTTAVNNYAVKMSDKYSVRGKYVTPDGVTMEGFGPILQAVDVQGLAADLKTCIEKGISGTRNAPYGARVEADNATLTDCVIVNLTAQHLYVYDKVGNCVVSTPIVSGCVYNDTETITGVFSIYAKSRNVTLTGPGYASPVKYWMPFSGGYGLHDANWRSVFGGEEYLFNGSHGCVNIPPAVAGTVYENVSVGTKVVIYGGTTSVSERPQNLEAVTTYKLSEKTAPFNLNVTALGKPELTYTSSNPEVAEVSADGTVTIKGLGKTVITVVAPAHAVTSPKPGAYLEGTLDITIEVLEGCSAGHSLVWEITKEPSCAAGEMTGTCTACGHVETKAIDPSKEHTYGEFTTTTEPGCETTGVSSATCSGCGGVKTETIPSKGHAYGNGDVCANGCGIPKPADPEPTDE